MNISDEEIIESFPPPIQANGSQYIESENNFGLDDE